MGLSCVGDTARQLGAVLGVALTLGVGGCGTTHTSRLARAAPVHRVAAVPTVGRPARIHLWEYAANIVDAGTPRGFVMFRRSSTVIRVTPSSAATLVEREPHAARFASPTARRQWLALGRPEVWTRPGSDITHVGVGQFSFLPTGGLPLTSAQLGGLGGPPNRLAVVLASHLPRFGKRVPAPVLLREYGYLLGWAPLSSAARKAIDRALLALPGVRWCGSADDLIKRRGDALCGADHELKIIAILSKRRTRVLGIDLVLRHVSPLYPGIPVGEVVEADAFSVR
jgi:hypothetical protein